MGVTKKIEIEYGKGISKQKIVVSEEEAKEILRGLKGLFEEKTVEEQLKEVSKELNKEGFGKWPDYYYPWYEHKPYWLNPDSDPNRIFCEKTDFSTKQKEGVERGSLDRTFSTNYGIKRKPSLR